MTEPLAPPNPRLPMFDLERCPDGHYPTTSACEGCRVLIRRRNAASVPVDLALGANPLSEVDESAAGGALTVEEQRRWGRWV